ncbi:MAG: hypothetical protein ACO1PN_06915 [Betaproteobacteria bacterium]
MGKKLPPQQLALYQAIDEILWQDWDPIGICNTEGPRDEYQMYLPQVFQLALAGDRASIADYLFKVATDRMGLITQRNQHLVVADKILSAKANAGAVIDDA